MGDVYQSAWFNDAQGTPCRIVYQEKGGILYERLEYEDGRLDPFQFEDDMICGFYFSKMGTRCVQVPQEILDDQQAFRSRLPRGTKILKGATTLTQV